MPAGPPGVYTVWLDDVLIYVGMSWKEGSVGLRGRLNSHASGRRSGDQFCVYIGDRFVLPELTGDEVRAIADGTLRFDLRIRDFIRSRLHYRFLICETGADARAIEAAVRQGAHGFTPSINPSNAPQPRTSSRPRGTS